MNRSLLNTIILLLYLGLSVGLSFGLGLWCGLIVRDLTFPTLGAVQLHQSSELAGPITGFLLLLAGQLVWLRAAGKRRGA